MNKLAFLCLHAGLVHGWRYSYSHTWGQAVEAAKLQHTYPFVAVTPSSVYYHSPGYALLNLLTYLLFIHVSSSCKYVSIYTRLTKQGEKKIRKGGSQSCRWISRTLPLRVIISCETKLITSPVWCGAVLCCDPSCVRSPAKTRSQQQHLLRLHVGDRLFVYYPRFAFTSTRGCRTGSSPPARYR